MRRILDPLYGVSLWLSALCLLAIVALVTAQVAGRIADNLLVLAGLEPYGFVVYSLAEIAGFLLAASSFLALAGALKSGVHIRVTLALGAVPARARAFLEVASLAAAAAFAAFAAWHLARHALNSWRLNELSTSLVPIKLWAPQAACALGAAVLAVALFDELAIAWRTGKPGFAAAEAAVNPAKEG
jgi:TRAP-type C4-dicarboxylate transport system permease small subunit